MHVPPVLFTYCTTILALESYGQIDSDHVPDPLDLLETTQKGGREVASWEVVLEWAHKKLFEVPAWRHIQSC